MATVLPPREVMLNPSYDLINSMGGYSINWEKTTCPPEGGMFSTVTGHPYPYKGHFHPQGAEATNLFKKFNVSLVSMVFPRRHYFSNLLFQYCRFGDYVFRLTFLKKQFYCSCSRELWDFSYLFLKHLGFNSDLSYRFGRLIAASVEGDNAYRLRIEDIFTETSKQVLMNNPKKEISRLIGVYKAREKQTAENAASEKMLKLLKILNWILLIPSVKSAFRFALKDSDFKNFQLDEIDRYWAYGRTDYDFYGIPEDVRSLTYRLLLLKGQGESKI